ncbi:hypothetical protein [Dinoroseobacter sp. S375]|uniref:hypothetical protein n=1 Tax=Dinoroseobacter sp. S375 TaxID=3415136 RepID=UPI003C7C7F46
MRLIESDIAGFSKKEAHDRSRNRLSQQGQTRLIRLPVLTYLYSDGMGGLTALRTLVQSTRASMDLARAFYRENSFERLDFEYRVRSGILPNPRDWRGNLEGIQPRYNAASGVLENPGDFMSPESYTGYAAFRIHGRDPARFGTGNGNPVLREYGNIHRRNIIADLITEIEAGPDHDWDDPESLTEIADWAFPTGGGGSVYVCSSQVNRAVKRTLPVATELAPGMPFQEIVLSSQGPGASSAQLHAHELGHLFFGIGDYYNRRVDGTRVTQEDALGYLGDASIMALHFDSPHFDGFLKFFLNWTDPQLVEPTFASREITLRPTYGAPGNALVIRPEKNRRPGEFFIVEYRTRNGRTPDGSAIRFDRNLRNPLENGVFVYHVNGTDIKGGAPGEAEPQVTLISGQSREATELRSLRTGQKLEASDTAFYGGHENGLEIEVLDITGQEARIRISWNRAPRLDVARVSGGDLHVFARKADGSPLHKRRTGSAWLPARTEWWDMGGEITERPTVAQAGDELSVWVRGVSGAPFYKRMAADGTWSPASWQNMGGEILGEVAPSKSGAFNEALVRGISGDIFVKQSRSTGWAPSLFGWHRLGGPFEGRPHGIPGPDGLHVVTRRAAGTPVHAVIPKDALTQSQPSWTELGGQLSADPHGCAHDGGILVCGRGISGKLFAKTLGSGGWRPSATGWTDLGGQIMGPPCAVSTGDHVVIFATGISGGVFAIRGTGGTWSDWAPLGGQVIDSPTAIVNGDHIEVVCTGISGNAFHMRWETSQWPPPKDAWSSLGGPLI